MWIKSNLGEVSTFISRGISPKYIEDGGIRVLNQKCIRNHEINYDLSRRHNFEFKKFSEDRFIKKGDVLINSTGQGTLGRVAQVRKEPKEPTTVDSHITIVRPKKDILYLEYFGYAAISIEKIIKNSGQGASGQTELAKLKVQNELEISFPQSLKEQKRIVTKLDDIFAELDLIISNTNLSKSNLDLILSRYLNNVFSAKDNFYSGTIKDFCSIISGRTVNKNLEKDSGDLPYLKVADMNIKGNEIEITTSSRFLDSKNINKRNIINKGAIIFPKRGGAIATNKKRITATEIAVDLNIMTVEPKDGLNPKLLFYYFLSIDLGLLGSGSSVPQINHYDIEPLEINFPNDASEQKSLVSNLDIFYNNIKKLEEIYTNKLHNLFALKSTILETEIQH